MSGILFALVVTLTPQPYSPVVGLTQWAVVVCGEPAVVSGGKVYQEAVARIQPVPRARVQEMLAVQGRRSGWRYLPAGLKLAGIGFTSFQAAEFVRINERKWQAMAPTATAVLEAVERLAGQRGPAAELPADLLPPWVSVPAGGCAEHSLFARPQQGEAPFRFEVEP